jgi:hypothetical protein
MPLIILFIVLVALLGGKGSWLSTFFLVLFIMVALLMGAGLFV